MARKEQTYIQKLTVKFLRAANQQARGNMRNLGGILLGGDPGVGKTTFMELFSDLTGIHLITIEVPHIVEEHIINIPFLVYNPQTGTKQTGRSQLQDKNPDNNDEYDMVLADSNLFTQITRARSMPDQQYVAMMTDPHPNSNRQRIAQQLFQGLGGTENKIPPMIQKLRQNFNCILFFDEYFREAPVRIRNILRDTINGNIGMHKIPANTFIVYASNMKDEGLDSIPLNTQMSQRIEFKSPTKKEWFSWIETKFKNDPHVQMKPQVLTAFKKVITDTTISKNDVASGVRISPRRWEQLLIYVNQSLPVDDRKDAVALLTNVRNNFVNYETGEYANLAHEVTKIVTYLIKQLSSVQDIKSSDKTAGSDWTDALNHHIKQHMKSGKHRKYIPVISGAPGVGKTSMIDKIAEKNNLVAVAIDSSRLSAEDVIGMPIPGQRSEKKMEVKFTVPQLYQQIINEIEDSAEEHFQDLLQKLGKEKAQEEFAKWEQQDWKYLIFFDELNRVDTKTFNSLRRIILEKNFGPSSDGKGGMLHLPDGSIVIGALNPDPETDGTESMTGHFRDVIDIINATPAWNKTRQFLLNKNNAGISDAAIDTTMFIIDEFVKKFKTKDEDVDKEQAPYYIQAGSSSIYVSPREYDALFSNMAPALDDVKKEILSDEEMTEHEGEELLADEVGEYMESGLLFPAEKSESTAPEEFISLIRQWIETKLSKKIYTSLITKKVKTEDTWGGVLSKYISGDRDVTKMPDDSSINTRMDATNAAQFVEEVSAAIETALDNSLKFLVLDTDHPKIELSDGRIITGKETTHRLGNIIMGLLFTLDQHNFQYDRIMAIGKALTSGAKRALKNAKGLSDEEHRDVVNAIAHLRADVHDALVEIKDES